MKNIIHNITTRKLASVQKIIDVFPIENSDNIEGVRISGWECIVKKDENFKIGDLVIYIEIDSIVPDKPEFEFLRKRKFRIRTIKLRGHVSQGLVIPLSILPKNEYKEGDDVTEILGIKKYDPQAEEEAKLLEEDIKKTNNRIHKVLLRYKWYRKLWPKKEKLGFTSFISKTDETRIQLLHNVIENYRGLEFIETEKLDGQSATYFLIQSKSIFPFKKKYKFGVCSRNLHLTKPNDSNYWSIANRDNIKKKMETIIGNNQYMVLQGEIIGPKIQGNKYDLKQNEFYAFNLIYPWGKIPSISAAQTLKDLDIKFVPIINPWLKLPATINEMVEHAKGFSKINPNTIREGSVIRNYDQNISFKVINPDFLLKHE